MERYNEKEGEYMVELFEASEGNATRATEIYLDETGKTIDHKTILKRWREKGLVGKYSHGGHRHGIKKEDFIRLYKELDGDCKKLIEETGLTRRTVVNRCYSYHLPVKEVSTSFKKKRFFTGLDSII